MSKFTIPHEAWLSDQDVHMQDIIGTIVQGLTNIQQQTNANGNGPQAAPPPQISSLTVTPDGNGFIHAQIFDNSPVQRGVEYFLEVSATSNFSRPMVIPLVASRDYRTFVGNTPLFYRAYSQYRTSNPSSPVYHGGATPAAVNAGGTVNVSFPNSSAGSGTADSNGTQGGSGFGTSITRSGVRLPQ